MTFEQRGKALARDVLQKVGAEPGKVTDPVIKNVMGAFLFGVISAYTNDNRKTPMEAQAVTLAILTEDFGMELGAAMDLHQFFVNSTADGFHPTTQKIINLAVNAYRYYRTGDYTTLKKGFDQIIAAMSQS